MKHCLAILGSLCLLAPVAAGQDPGAGRGAARPGGNALLRVLDSDGDGKLSKQEIEGAPKALLSLDADANGEVSARELPSPPGGGRAAEAAASLEQAPIAMDAAERKVLDVLADLDANRRGNMNVPENDGRLLRMLAETTRATNVVEIGTSNGYSAIWLCLGLRATGGKLVTHEIDPERAAIARRNFERAGVADLVTIVEGDAHETVKQLDDPIDILFIDADKSGYLDYLRQLQPRIRPGGLIVSHNMNRPAPDPAFVKAITTDPALETLFFHMDAAGIAVSLKKAKP